MEKIDLAENDRRSSSSIEFHNTYDWSVTAPSVAAINALATVKNVDPIELATEFDTRLYECIDPEALDAIIGNGRPGSISVSFILENYQLRFNGDELAVRSRDQ